MATVYADVTDPRTGDVTTVCAADDEALEYALDELFGEPSEGDRD